MLRREQDGNWRTIGNTNGRPLGLRADGAGGVWIADSMRGLLHLSGTGQMTVVATDMAGSPLKFVDDLDIDVAAASGSRMPAKDLITPRSRSTSLRGVAPAGCFAMTPAQTA